jgi:hypothetical protein
LIRFQTHEPHRGATISFLTRILVAVYLIESGLMLTASPWMTTWWRHNYFAERSDAVRAFMVSDRGWMLVVGVGLLSIIGGVVDLYGTFARRAREAAAAATSLTPDR